MAKGEYDLERELHEWYRGAGRIVIVGVGNPIRMDDFIGVKIVQDLRGKVDSDRVMLVEAETLPEDHMQQILDFRPTHVLIIDAARQGLEAGAAKLIEHSELTGLSVVSTHMLPLRIFCEYLTGSIGTAIALLLIEPETTQFGEGLSPTAIQSRLEIARVLGEMFT